MPALRPFLQKQAVGLRARKLGEKARDIVFAQRVAYGAQNHTLMVRHMAADDLERLPVADAVLGEIRRFKQAERTFHAQGLQLEQVGEHALYIQRHAQQGGVGRDDVLIFGRVQRERWDAKSLILIVKVGIKGIVAAFADAEYAVLAVGLLLAQSA